MSVSPISLTISFTHHVLVVGLVQSYAPTDVNFPKEVVTFFLFLFVAPISPSLTILLAHLLLVMVLGATTDVNFSEEGVTYISSSFVSLSLLSLLLLLGSMTLLSVPVSILVTSMQALILCKCLRVRDHMCIRGLLV